MEYNTQREDLILREYGRNVQRMADHLMKIDDRQQRNTMAAALVELMKSINPNINNSQEYDQKVWDDLVIISEFKLDADGPYPKPEPTILHKKPRRVEYQSNNIQYRHYGKSIEKLIEKAIELTDEQEKKGAVIQIGKLMKSFYNAWNREQTTDEQVVTLIKRMSDNRLDIPLEEVAEFELFDMNVKQSRRPNDNYRNNDHRKGGGRQQKGKKNNNRRRRNN